MKKAFVFVLSAMMILVSLMSYAEDVDLSGMDISELYRLDEKLHSEMITRLQSSGRSISKGGITIEITNIEVTDKRGVNKLYDKYEPGIGTSSDGAFLIIEYTMTNNTDITLDDYTPISATINGWMVNTYVGIKEVLPNSKCKGFINMHMDEIEEKTLQEINTVYVKMEERNADAYGSVVKLEYYIIFD